MKTKIILSLVAGIVFVSLFVITNNPEKFSSIKNFLASVFFVESIHISDLRDRYQNYQTDNKKIKILIVPGHDNDSFGTIYKGMKEADIAADLGEKLFKKLSSKEEFRVILARNRQEYNPVIQNFMNENKEEIVSFMTNQRKLMASYVESGEIKSNNIVSHNPAIAPTALKLYGINKWANENDIDVVINIHFNDYSGRTGKETRYRGFSIYVPERQYSNSKASRSIGEFVSDELEKVIPKSNLPIEKDGVIDEQELIAIGSNNSLDGASVLIEYGYIYENPITDKIKRDERLELFAKQTENGIINFFNSRDSLPKIFSSSETTKK